MEDSAPKRKRGRPRPLDVIERDNQADEILRNSDVPLTCSTIADMLNTTQNRAYLSLCRLRKEGRVRRHNNAWITV